MGKNENTTKPEKRPAIGDRVCFSCRCTTPHFLKAPAFDVFCPACAPAQDDFISTPALDRLRAAPGVSNPTIFGWWR